MKPLRIYFNSKFGFQDERKSSKGIREAIAMANQAFHLELNVSLKDFYFSALLFDS